MSDDLMTSVEAALDEEPTSLAMLLDDVEAFIRRFVSFTSPHQSVTVTLFVAHTHAIEAAETTGYLHVKSAEKRCGKTRLLETLDLLVKNPVRASTISSSVLFRLFDSDRRTLLLDETDAIFSPKTDREELRGLLNAGYRRGSPAWRSEAQGKSYTPRAYDPFGAKVLASIGSIPDTLADRCIEVELRRRRVDEEIESFRFREVKAEAAPLRSRLEDWCTDATVATLSAARPQLPALEDDRALDAWDPLLAIADMAGGHWPEEARLAAVALQGSKVASIEERAGVLTLAAIRDLFGDHVDRLTTEQILAGLVVRDDGPWSYWFADDLERAGREGKPALKAARRLARTLEPFGIRPDSIKDAEGTRRGYMRSSFDDSWSRYLPTTATSATSATSLASTVSVVAEVAVDVTPVKDPRASERAANESPSANREREPRTSGWQDPDDETLEYISGQRAAGVERFTVVEQLKARGVPPPPGWEGWTVGALMDVEGFYL
jgi:hypothetical protein